MNIAPQRYTKDQAMSYMAYLLRFDSPERVLVPVAELNEKELENLFVYLGCPELGKELQEEYQGADLSLELSRVVRNLVREAGWVLSYTDTKHEYVLFDGRVYATDENSLMYCLKGL